MSIMRHRNHSDMAGQMDGGSRVCVGWVHVESEGELDGDYPYYTHAEGETMAKELRADAKKARRQREIDVAASIGIGC